jgi:hypothetical protein
MANVSACGHERLQVGVAKVYTWYCSAEGTRFHTNITSSEQAYPTLRTIGLAIEKMADANAVLFAVNRN